MGPLSGFLLELVGIPLLFREDGIDSVSNMIVDRLHQPLGQGDEPRLPEFGYYTTTPKYMPQFARDAG